MKLFLKKKKECNRIGNMMTRTQFSTILQNLHFPDNQRPEKLEKTCKLRPVIDHLNTVYQVSLSNADKQGTDKHITKFKAHHSCKQYVKNPIK